MGGTLTKNIFADNLGDGMMEVNGREEVVVPAEDELVKGSRVGRVVPFFPTDWNKSSNNMFN